MSLFTQVMIGASEVGSVKPLVKEGQTVNKVGWWLQQLAQVLTAQRVQEAIAACHLADLAQWFAGEKLSDFTLCQAPWP